MIHLCKLSFDICLWPADLFAKSCKVYCVVWHEKDIGFSLYGVPCQEKQPLRVAVEEERPKALLAGYGYSTGEVEEGLGKSS